MTHWQRDHKIGLWLLPLIVAFLTDCSTGTWIAAGGRGGNVGVPTTGTRPLESRTWGDISELICGDCLVQVA